MLPAFEIVHRLRPITLVARERTTGFVAPYAAVETELGTHDVAGRVVAGFRGSDGLRLEGWYDGGRRLAGLDLTDAAGRTTHHRSRRHGRPDTPPEAIATTLTGRQLTVLTRNDGTWTARARVDLGDRVTTGDPEVLAGLEADIAWLPRAPGDRSPVTSWRAGTFGQLGVRDVGLVTGADGSPVERDGLLFLTMTHAGPGFFDTAHTGVWSFDPETLAVEHRGDLYLRRDGTVLGDHAVHLVRDGDRWLLASSTWGDFDRTTMAITLATSTDDLLAGEHVLDTEPLDLPTADLPGRVVGTWDPHLVQVDGRWHLAFVAARRFFDFYPALGEPEGHGQHCQADQQQRPGAERRRDPRRSVDGESRVGRRSRCHRRAQHRPGPRALGQQGPPQLAGEDGDVRPAALPVRVDGAQQHVVHRRRQRRQPRRARRQPGVDEVAEPALADQPTGEHLVGHRAERVHVGAGVDPLAGGLLGRHVGRRADDLGEPAGVDHRLGHAEVGDQQPDPRSAGSRWSAAAGSAA